MKSAGLSSEQEAILEPEVRVVEAGPGSGKTRALVARYLTSASSSKRGVGLLSFTNAAVDEVRARSQGRAGLLQAPHFVGTIDSFLHRFVVTPWAVPQFGKVPSYLRSWDDLPSDRRMVRLAHVPGSGIRLSRFRVDETSEVTIDSEALPWDEGAYLKKVVNENAYDQLLSVGRSRIVGLTNSGVFDSSASRVKAFAIVEGAGGSALIDRIALRFEEVLIDEAQDCDSSEFSIIERLSSRIRTVVVADPDQAIYEFRGSVPKLFLEYRDAVPEEARRELTINYRSSPSICQTITSLRVAGQSSVTAAEGAEGGPVYVLTGSASEQRAKFKTLLVEHGLALDDAMVLAHRWSTAYSAAGRAPAETDSQAAGNMLAVACNAMVKPTSTASERLKALHTVEAIVLNLIEWPEGIRTTSNEERVGAISKTAEWLRIESGKLVSGLRGISDRAGFGVKARSILSSVLGDLPFPHATLGNRIKKPSDAVWAKCNAIVEEGDALSCSSIHGAKGHEYKAVLVALPSSLPKIDDRDVLDDWEGGFNSEPRRVLYVASSRPEQLLAFGAGSNSDRLLTLLASGGVPVEAR